MTLRSIPISLVTVIALVGVVVAQPKHTPPKTDKEKIANAMSAAPKAVAQEATIMDMDEKGQMKVLREGKGPFTCLSDNPTTPGNDPMCLDKAGMEWAKAWMGKTQPPAGVGFGYMLMGGSDASNDDPYATKPAPGKKWVGMLGPTLCWFAASGLKGSLLVRGHRNSRDWEARSRSFVAGMGIVYHSGYWVGLFGYEFTGVTSRCSCGRSARPRASSPSGRSRRPASATRPASSSSTPRRSSAWVAGSVGIRHVWERGPP
jgi:hypothetical protein